MNRSRGLLLGVALLAGCSSTPTQPPTSVPTVGPSATLATVAAPSPTATAPPAPTPVPTAAGIQACSASELQLTPGHSGDAAGTAYLEVAVALVGGTDCTMPAGPALSIVDSAGKVFAPGTEVDPTPVTIHGTVGYHIGWNIPCEPSATPGSSLAARIQLGDGSIVTMPIGDFGPSCVDGSTGALFMNADPS